MKNILFYIFLGSAFIGGVLAEPNQLRLILIDGKSFEILLTDQHELKSSVLQNFFDAHTDVASDISDLKSKIVYVDIPENVVKVEQAVFESCINLQSVTFPASLEIVAEKAFLCCERLEEINIPEENNLTAIDALAFAGCKSLKFFILPKRQISIGEYAFFGCRNLEIIDLGMVTFMGDYAFADCRSLKKVNLPNNIEKGRHVFWNTRVPTAIEEVSSEKDKKDVKPALPTFLVKLANNETLDIACILPDNTGGALLWYIFCIVLNIEEQDPLDWFPFFYTSIVEEVFFSRFILAIYSTCLSEKEEICRKNKKQVQNFLDQIRTISIPDDIQIIGRESFKDCENLKSIIVQASVTSIEAKAFRKCYELISITLPKYGKLATIGEHAFSSCKKLTSITIPNCVISIGNGAFEWCENLRTITIPAGIKDLNSNIFLCCSSLVSVVIPNGVISVAKSAFSLCKSLTSIAFPPSILSIANDAFLGCKNLWIIVLPASFLEKTEHLSLPSGCIIFFNSLEIPTDQNS